MTVDELHLAETELTQIREELETIGHPNAIENTILEQEENVTNRCARYAVPTLTLKRLTRALVLYHLYLLLNQVSEARQKDYDGAIKELSDIAAGKIFLPVSDTQPAPAAGAAAWGSREKIL